MNVCLVSEKRRIVQREDELRNLVLGIKIIPELAIKQIEAPQEMKYI